MARTGRPYTKLYRAERERPVLLWVDLRPSMFFATRGVLKAVQAARIAAMVAWTAVDHGDRLGGIVQGAGAVTELRPTRGTRGALAMIGTLAKRFPGDPSSLRGETPDTLAGLPRVARPGSLVVLLSDLAGLDALEHRHLAQLGRHSDVALVAIHDPIEAQLPPPGTYRLTDGRSEWSMDTGGHALRRDHLERHRQRMTALERRCREHRMRWIPCSTAEDPTEVLRERLAMPANHG